eukprot:scaffold164225_cov20-Tisochrysis_lutea.AAC.2
MVKKERKSLRQPRGRVYVLLRNPPMPRSPHTQRTHTHTYTHAGANGGPLDPEAPTPDLMAQLTQRAAQVYEGTVTAKLLCCDYFRRRSEHQDQAASAASALPPHPPEVHPEILPTLYVVSNHVNDDDFP